MSDERRYSEAELRSIIGRAAERQEAVRRAQAAGEDGLTLDELQEIGAASGIDPAHIAAAAKELARPTTAPKPGTLVGMPTALRQSRFLPHPVTDAEWAKIVAELRDTFDASGVAGEVGDTREWMTQVRRKSGGAIHFTLEPVEGGTHVTVEQSWRGSAWAFTGVSGGYAFTALTLGMLFLVGALDSGSAFVPVMFAVLALMMFGGAQIGTRLYAQRQEKRFEHALDRIELIARDPVRQPDTPHAHTDAEMSSRIDLDAVTDVPEETRAVPRNRTRS